MVQEGGRCETGVILSAFMYKDPNIFKLGGGGNVIPPVSPDRDLK